MKFIEETRYLLDLDRVRITTNRKLINSFEQKGWYRRHGSASARTSCFSSFCSSVSAQVRV